MLNHLYGKSRIIILVAAGLTLASCSKTPTNGASASPPTFPSSTPELKPFVRQVYRSLNNQQIITLASPTELELGEQGMNLVCTYTEQDNTLRVVENIAGTTQAIYYQITPTGLQANDGTFLFAPQPYAEKMQEIQLARQRQEQERQRIAAEQEQSRNVTNEVANFSLNSAGQNIMTPDTVTVTNCSLKLHFAGNIWNEIKFADIVKISDDPDSRTPNTIDVQFQDQGNPGVMLLECHPDAENHIKATLLDTYHKWSRAFPDIVIPASNGGDPSSPDLR